MLEVLNPEGVETLMTFTTTELDVEVHPAGEVIVKVYVPEDERLINQIHPVKLMDYSSNIVLGDIIH